VKTTAAAILVTPEQLSALVRAGVAQELARLERANDDTMIEWSDLDRQRARAALRASGLDIRGAK